MRDGIERPGIQPVRKRIVHEKRRHREHAWIERRLVPEPLQRAEVVRVAELCPQRFENLPVPCGQGRPYMGVEMAVEIGRDAVVMDQRVVQIEERDDVVGHDVRAYLATYS